MIRLLPKHPQIRLQAEAYATLRRKILELAGQWPDSSSITYSGGAVRASSEHNLITLCSNYHRAIHA